jgi:hypothetical protein
LGHFFQNLVYEQGVFRPGFQIHGNNHKKNNCDQAISFQGFHTDGFICLHMQYYEKQMNYDEKAEKNNHLLTHE